MEKSVRLKPGMKFMSGGVLYKQGDILPETDGAADLVERGICEYIDKPQPSQEGSPSDDYDGKTVKELVGILKEKGITIPKGTAKPGMIELLISHDEGSA